MLCAETSVKELTIFSTMDMCKTHVILQQPLQLHYRERIRLKIWLLHLINSTELYFNRYNNHIKEWSQGSHIPQGHHIHQSRQETHSPQVCSEISHLWYLKPFLSIEYFVLTASMTPAINISYAVNSMFIAYVKPHGQVAAL